jgi:hypothetical protein
MNIALNYFLKLRAADFIFSFINIRFSIFLHLMQRLII